jgi:hypothetical protein
MCFSLQWLGSVLVWLVVICAVVAIIQVLVPWVLSIAGWSPSAPVLQILRIIVGAVIIIVVIWFVIDLISCIGGFPSLRMRLLT